VAETHVLGGRYADAARFCEQATASSPTFGWAWFVLGGARRLQEDWTRAEAAYRKALECMPGHPAATERLASMQACAGKARAKSFLMQGQQEQAAALLRELVLATPWDEEAMTMLAEALMSGQRNDSDPLAEDELHAFELSRQLLDTMLDAAEAHLGRKE
jgi:tetratricopeptide (TPR) repeat protein